MDDWLSGWDYGPGNANDSGVNYDWEGGGGSSSGFWSGLGGAVGGLVGTYANTWSQKTLMQTAQDGQLKYMEGQPSYRLASQAMGGINPLFLLIGAGLVFVLAIKK